MSYQVVAEIAIVPVGTASPSLSNYIAACLQAVKKARGVRYQLTATGTIVEGSLERVLRLVQRMHQVPFDMGVQRVVTTIKIDDRRDKPATIESKVQAVLKKG